MGVSTNGTSESGAPATLIGQAPTDSGAQWISGGTTADGKPILTQVTAQANPDLQVYILANYGSASPGGVPSQFTYDRPSGTGSTNVTGPFTQLNKTDVDFVRNTTADAAGMVSTNAGRFSAATAAAASIPSPFSPGLSAASYAASVAGIAADALGQLVKPDVGQYTNNGLVSIVANAASEKYPGLAPAINETSNTINNSNISNAVQKATNNYWQRIVDSVTGGAKKNGKN
jgi:filamentous hemagglutinin